jgi:hypothetical protein
MRFMPEFSRRSFIRFAAAAPLLGQIAARNVLASAAAAVGKDPKQNVYTRLGKDRHQLPWHLDLPERLSRIS